jgi:hypothetical protein
MVVMDNKTDFPRGGHGGSVKITSNTGIAVGGCGGRGGGYDCGSGGDGGGGVHHGLAMAIGGDGGDAGRHGRPALGAPSALERLLGKRSLGLEDPVDSYGILQPGRGGDSYYATIEVDGRCYSLNILLRLLQIWDSSIIDKIDDLEPANEQEWWNKTVLFFPEMAQKAMAHIQYCEDITSPRGLPPKDPYQ